MWALYVQTGKEEGSCRQKGRVTEALNKTAGES